MIFTFLAVLKISMARICEYTFCLNFVYFLKLLLVSEFFMTSLWIIYYFLRIVSTFCCIIDFSYFEEVTTSWVFWLEKNNFLSRTLSTCSRLTQENDGTSKKCYKNISEQCARLTCDILKIFSHF